MKLGARVVMIWPEFVVGEADVTIKAEERVAQLGWQQQPLISAEAARILRIPDPNVLTYGRDDAKVRRQIRRWIFVR